MLLQTLSKTSQFLKDNWSQVGCLVLMLVLIVSRLGHVDSDVDKRFAKMQSIHDEEISKILDAQEQERRTNEENFKRLQQELEDVKRKREEALSVIEAKKTKQVETIVHQYDEDPVGVARQLSSMTGFTVVLP